VDGELIFMGFLPALISTCIIVCSYLLLVGKRVIPNALLFIINFAINTFALSMFIPMLQGAYPTILPHLLVLLTLPILVVQFKMYKNERQDCWFRHK
jgi:hypothetical protein